MFNTAVDDEIIKRNPCRIKGAGSEDSPERPVLTVAEVYALADAVGLRYRSLILLAAFTSLRWAELAALTPADIDLDARTVRVTRQLYYHEKPAGDGSSSAALSFELAGEHLDVGPPDREQGQGPGPEVAVGALSVTFFGCLLFRWLS